MSEIKPPPAVASGPPASHETVIHHDDTSTNRVVFVAVDGSKHSEYAFQWGLENFVKQGDLVVLFHVRPYPAVPGYASRPLQAPYTVLGTTYTDFAEMLKGMDEQHRLESHAMLKAFAEKLKAKSIPCKAITMRGDAREEIVRKVNELGADVLIMGSRGLGALKRTLLGSVSDYCAHSITVPIIIVKEPTQEV